ncbi:MAG: hypothetical protein MUF34_20490 [Polyangiaceae bacterium]|nr:hypothetical protein [Polyangiaceae bacterium]
MSASSSFGASGRPRSPGAPGSPGAPTRVYFTVDVECSEERLVGGAWRPALGYDLRVWGRLANQRRELGIDLIMRELEAVGGRGTFFLEALGAHHFGRAGLAEACQAMVARGHDVQLHTHPVQRHAAFHSAGEAPASDNIGAYDVDRQAALLREGVDLLAEAGAPRDRLLAFRAGNFGANNDTWRAMADAGLRVSSNYNPCYFTLHCKMRSPRAQAGLFATETPGVYELPVSTFVESGGGFRHLQITAVSLREMLDALRQYRALGVGEVTVVTHSFEFFFLDSHTAKTGRPNQVNIERMRGLLRFIADNPRDFALETVAELAARLPQGTALPDRELALPQGKPWLRAGRFAEQGYKRFVERAGARLPLPL